MNQLRVSYTLLSLWKQGKIDEAINYYFKLGSITTPAMEEGIKWDTKAGEHAIKYKELLKEFGGDKLNNPKPQFKIEQKYHDNFELVGVIDLLDEPIIYEYKTGSSKDSGNYAEDYQVGIYLLLAHMAGLDIEKAIIVHYNQHANERDRSIIYNTEYERDRARNFIDTIGSDVYTFFDENDLFNKKPTIDFATTNSV